MIISIDEDGYTRVYSENGEIIGIFESDGDDDE